MANSPHRCAMLLTAVALVACGGSEEPPPAPPPSSVRPYSAAEAGIDSSVVAISIEGEGLRLFVIATGAARPLPFGTDSSSVFTAIQRATRSDPVESGDGGDCPGSYARWSNGLTLRFDDGKFVGWSLRDGDNSVSTPTGIGIGTTRANVDSAVVITVKGTSLGPEFTAGQLAGLLDGTTPASKVTHLWAGETCIAR